jgi:hypothetical protein
VTAATARVATALAIALAGRAAWGHTFPPVHSVVIQVERCELAVLIGYAAGTGEPTERIVARAASQPKSHVVDALRDTLAAYAMAPIALSVDGAPLAPTSVQAKLGLGGGGQRPVVVVLATYALPAGGRLALTSADPRTTRISWEDRSGGRVDHDRAPAPGRYVSGVASFLLPIAPPPGDHPCASPHASPDLRSRPPR